MHRTCLTSAAFVLYFGLTASLSCQQSAATVALDGGSTSAAPAPSRSPDAVQSHQWTKKDKVPYTGPTQIVELPPTPMLDEEGRQRIDPDGKPMFNPPVKQQRDKYGHPLFEAGGKPVFRTATELGYDENGKKLHTVKEKAPKVTPMLVKSGVLTVDGLPGKAALNYQIADVKFLYFYAPWIGTAVVSTQPFPGAKEQQNAFNDKSVTVSVGEHTFQLTSDDRLLGKKPQSAFVLVDRDFKLPTRQPVMGFGETLRQPYVWPGSKAQAVTGRKIVEAPPLPTVLRPTQLLPPCPSGQMRRTSRPSLPGDTAQPEPCVPILAGSPMPVPETRPAAATPAPATTTPTSAPAEHTGATTPSQLQ